jgi:hypothetical protein
MQQIAMNGSTARKQIASMCFHCNGYADAKVLLRINTRFHCNGYDRMTTNCLRWWSLLGSPEVIKGRAHENARETRVEAGSNTSTVTLQVVGGDEKRSLKSETVKYGLKSQGTRTRE